MLFIRTILVLSLSLVVLALPDPGGTAKFLGHYPGEHGIEESQ
jgi:hypothetical protein